MEFPGIFVHVRIISSYFGHNFSFPRNIVVEDPRPTLQHFMVAMQGVEPWSNPETKRDPGDLIGILFQVIFISWNVVDIFRMNWLISEHNHRCPECTRGARGFVGHVRRADLRLGLWQRHHWGRENWEPRPVLLQWVCATTGYSIISYCTVG